jgi:hypothetical protein
MSEAGMVTPYVAPQVRLVATGERPRPAGASVLADFEQRSLPAGFRRRGGAFGVPQPAVVGDLPILGPHGGELLMGSARGSAGLRATGVLESPVFQAPVGGTVELLVGTSGAREGLEIAVEVLVVGDAQQREPRVNRRLPLPLPEADPWRLAPLRWQVPAELAGQPLRLVITDESPSAAIFIDDLWIIGGAGGS